LETSSLVSTKLIEMTVCLRASQIGEISVKILLILNHSLAHRSYLVLFSQIIKMVWNRVISWIKSTVFWHNAPEILMQTFSLEISLRKSRNCSVSVNVLMALTTRWSWVIVCWQSRLFSLMLLSNQIRRTFMDHSNVVAQLYLLRS
jgi:hypothetical protein